MRTDEQLLQSGTPADFGLFYERHVDAVLAYVGRRCNQPDISFDIVAETFARALLHARQYDPARGPAAAWLIGIARNHLIDAARANRVDSRAREALRMTTPELDDRDLERVEARLEVDVARLLEWLPEGQREVVISRVFRDERYPEIARRLGLSEQVIRKRFSRGLAKLRQALESPS